MDAPNNCWPANTQKFADAVVASPTFRELVGLPYGPDEEVQARVFGKRLRFSRNGRAWTRDELATLRAYAMVFCSPDNPFGYHLVNNAHYESHGAVCVAFGRLIPDADLVDPGPDSTGLTEAHDRQWENIAGTIIKEVMSWLAENGGPYPIPSVSITDNFEEAAKTAGSVGAWQYTEVTFQYGLAG